MHEMLSLLFSKPMERAFLFSNLILMKNGHIMTEKRELQHSKCWRDFANVGVFSKNTQSEHKDGVPLVDRIKAVIPAFVNENDIFAIVQFEITVRMLKDRW